MLNKISNLEILKQQVKGLFPSASKKGINSIAKILEQCCCEFDPCDLNTGQHTTVNFVSLTVNGNQLCGTIKVDGVDQVKCTTLPVNADLDQQTLSIINNSEIQISNGNSVDICPIVKLCETQTTLNSLSLLNNILSVSYTGENGIPQIKTIDLTGIVLPDINTSTFTYNPLTGDLVITETDGSTYTVTIAPTLETLTTYTDILTSLKNKIGEYKDEQGNITDVFETLTLLTDNGNDTYTYISENGTETIINIKSTKVVSTDGTVKVTSSVSGNETTFDLSVKSHSFEKQSIAYSGIELPTTTGTVIGDTKTVQFNNNTEVNYTWNGAAWVVDFVEETNICVNGSCDNLLQKDVNGCLVVKGARVFENTTTPPTCTIFNLTAPSASSLALLTYPLVNGDRIEEAYNGGKYIFTYDSCTNSWGTKFIPKDCTKIHCTPQLIGRLPANPFAQTPQEILVTGTTIDMVNGVPLVPPTGMKPFDCFTVYASNGSMQWCMGANCQLNLCGTNIQIDPVIHLSSTVQCCLDNAQVTANVLQGELGLHFIEYTVIKTDNTVIYSDQTPSNNLPAFDINTNTGTFTGYQLQDGDIVCATLYSQNTPDPIFIVAQHCLKIEKFYFVDNEIPLICDNGEIAASEFPFIIENDNTFIANQVDLTNWVNFNYPNASYCADNCSYCVALPIVFNSIPFTFEVKKVIPFVKANLREESCSNELISGEIINNKTQIIGDPITPSTGFEQKTDFSNDGVTWYTDSAYTSSAIWVASTNMHTPMTGNAILQNGGYIRNCIRKIGTTIEYCDIKRLPLPTVGVDILSAIDDVYTFINNATETNSCFLGEKRKIVITLTNDTAPYLPIETFVSAEFTGNIPTKNVLLSGASSAIKNLINSTSGNTISTQKVENLKFQYIVKNEYSCISEPSHTATSLIATSSTTYTSPSTNQQCGLNLANIVNETGINFAANGTSNPNSKIGIYKEDGTFVTYIGQGTFNQAGITAGYYAPNSNYPLPEGKYYITYTSDNNTEKYCTCFYINKWDICSESVKMSYNGLVGLGSINYDLPISSSLTSIQSLFSSYVIPDRYIIRYNGTVLYDSTQISVTNQLQQTPFTYVTGVDTIQIEVIPDPSQPPNTVTTFDLIVGCCKIVIEELPYRDPNILYAGATECDGVNLGYNFPYHKESYFNTYYHNINSLPFNGACLSENTLLSQGNAFYSGFAYGGCSIQDNRYANCLDFGLPIHLNVLSTSSSQHVVEYTNTTSYNQSKDWINTTLAFLATVPFESGKNYHQVNLVGAKNVNCLSDGNVINGIIVGMNASMFVFDDALQTITVNNNLVNNSTDCCALSENLSNLFAAWATMFTNIGSALPSIANRVPNVIPSAIQQGAGNMLYYPFDWGIISSSLTNTNPVQNYYIEFDKNSAATTWALKKGTYPTGTVVTSASNGNWQFAAGAPIIMLFNESGLLLQEINYSTATFDLTYYGGGVAESFADIVGLRNRIQALTGQSFDYHPVYNALKRTSGSGTIQNITVKNP